MTIRLPALEVLEPRILLNGDVASVGRTVLAGSAEEIRIEYGMPELELVAAAGGGEGETLYQAVLGDAPTYGEPGRPVLPVVPVQIVLPAGFELAGVTVEADKKVTAAGEYLIAQGAEALAYSLDATAEPTPLDMTVYGSDEAYPKTRFDDVEVQYSRGVAILTVNLHPVEYLPVRGLVSCYTSLVVTVDLVASDGDEGGVVPYRPATGSDLAESVDNPDALATYTDGALAAGPQAMGIPDPADSYQYVVITSQAMLDAASDYTIGDFISYKQSLGYTVTAVTMESIDADYPGADSQEKLRNFIADAYNYWETDYVLLAGDSNIIPARGLRVVADDEVDDLPSDLYYQCLDGTFDDDGDGLYGEPNDGIGGGEVDLMAEVAIGRVPAENASEMANWVYKTLAYENDPTGAYRDRALIVGEYLGEQFGPGEFSYAKPYMEEIRLGSSAGDYTTSGFSADPEISVDTLYDADGTWDASELIDRIDPFDGETYGIINHLGHADTDYVMKLYNSDVDDLTNNNFYFIYSQGCLPGNFVSDAVAEHFTTSTRHGAVAVVFNSRYGWGQYNESSATLDSPSQRMNRQFWDALFGEGIDGLGAMNADSHEDNIWGVSDPYVRWVMYETNLFGDPALELGSDVVEGIDLRGSSFDVSPDNLRVSGSQATVSFGVENRGDTSAGAFNVRFYLSDDETIDASDTLLAVQGTGATAYAVASLAAGTTHAGSVTLVVPDVDPFGTDNDYFIGMVVDADGAVAEAFEDNNASTGLYRDYDDVYYDFTGPRVDSHAPAGLVTEAQGSIRFRFDEPMDPASFDAGDDVVSFTGPGGDLLGEVTGGVWVNSQTLDVQFAAQGQVGTYTMVLGPDIADVSGNAMDQDGDGTNGEAVQDRAVAVFTIVDALYTADMTSDPGWSLDGDWAWGIPTGGGSGQGDPTAGHTGDRVIGYNLGGDYSNELYVAEYATTPAIDCTGYEDITLSFYRWLGVEMSDYDHACVQVSNDGLTWVEIWQNPNYDIFDSGWAKQEFDISDVADGQPTVTVRWGMGPTDYSVAYPGWNLDDVMMIGTPEALDSRGPGVVSHTPASLVGDAQSAVTFTFNDTMDPAGFDAGDDVVSFTGPGGDLAGEITGGTWLDAHTLSVQFASQSAGGTYTMVIGPGIPDDAGNPMDQDGDGLAGEPTDDRYTATFDLVDVAYFADMDSDPGWTLDAGSGEFRWQWGIPVGGGSHAGDPTGGFTGSGVIGYNLSGDYADNLTAQYATTPAIDCSDYQGVSLSFYRWLGIESSYFDHADVQVSNDGATWHDVWVHTERNISEAQWVYQEFDISAVADGQGTVHVRWGMGPTDDSVTYPGWNLDDVMVTGIGTGSDEHGPAVVSHTPAGSITAAATAMTFSFSDTMDTTSFSVAEDVVSFTGPGGDLAGEITGFSWLNPHMLEVSFPAQSAVGVYRMTLGPDVLDDAGNPMDQDGDKTNGEAVEDRYTGAFEIAFVAYWASMDTDPGWDLDPGSGSDRWQWGIPTGGGSYPGDPTSGHTGTHVIGYDLSGNYPNNLSAQYATVGPIDCTGLDGVTLSYYRWLGVESREYDEADVWISADNVHWTEIWRNPTQALTDSAWVYQEFDISAVAGDQPAVYVRWCMGPTDVSQAYAGWNLDDVLVMGVSGGPGGAGPAVTSHSPEGQTGGDLQAVTFTFDADMDPAGFDLADDVVRFTGPGGDLLADITGYAWLDARTLEVQLASQDEPGTYAMVIGPDIPDVYGNAMDQDGDLINGEPSQDRYTATFEVLDVLYLANMDADPGWSLDGDWAWGTPAGGGSGAGDPTAGFTGSGVIGYNLLGDYEDYMDTPEYATLGPIDCSGAEDVTLSFYRWLAVESYQYDHAGIQVSDDGVYWSDIWMNPVDDLVDTDWSYQELDISTTADGEATVYIRWSMGPSDSSYTYCGWNLDDVMVTCYQEPLGGDDAYGAMPGEATSVPASAGVLANDTPRGDGALQAVLLEDAAAGDLTLHSDGSFDYTPYAETYGFDQFVYAADDGQGASEPCTVTLTVVIPGDVDLDRTVNFLDYLAVKASLGTGQGAAWSGGDFDFDGAVGRSDLVALAGHFGQSYVPAEPPPADETPATSPATDETTSDSPEALLAGEPAERGASRPAADLAGTTDVLPVRDAPADVLAVAAGRAVTTPAGDVLLDASAPAETTGAEGKELPDALALRKLLPLIS